MAECNRSDKNGMLSRVVFSRSPFLGLPLQTITLALETFQLGRNILHVKSCSMDPQKTVLDPNVCWVFSFSGGRHRATQKHHVTGAAPGGHRPIEALIAAGEMKEKSARQLC